MVRSRSLVFRVPSNILPCKLCRRSKALLTGMYVHTKCGPILLYFPRHVCNSPERLRREKESASNCLFKVTPTLLHLHLRPLIPSLFSHHRTMKTLKSKAFTPSGCMRGAMFNIYIPDVRDCLSDNFNLCNVQFPNMYA